MATYQSNQPPTTTKEEYYAMVLHKSISAMRLRKLGDRHSAYPQEITSLAKTCAELMTAHKEPVQEVITHIEHALSSEHKKEMVIIQSKISTLFNRRKKTHSNTLFGENEIIDLTLQISFLERRKTTPFSEIIKHVITDTLKNIAHEHNIELLNGINPEDYEYHDEAQQVASAPSEPPIGNGNPNWR